MTKDLIYCLKGAVNGQTGAGAQLRTGTAQDGADGVQILIRLPVGEAMQGFIGLYPVLHVGLIGREGFIIPGVAVRVVFHVQAEDGLRYLEGIGPQAFGEESA